MHHEPRRNQCRQPDGCAEEQLARRRFDRPAQAPGSACRSQDGSFRNTNEEGWLMARQETSETPLFHFGKPDIYDGAPWSDMDLGRWGPSLAYRTNPMDDMHIGPGRGGMQSAHYAGNKTGLRQLAGH
jgi:hypothetical protein